jgi:hypothetical protein
MISSVDKRQNPVGSLIPAARTRTERYVGEVVYIYAFDVAYEMTRRPVPTLLGQPVEQFCVDSDKRTPRHPFFYRPEMVRLPSHVRMGPYGPVKVDYVIKLLPIGGISITIRVPFSVAEIDDLVVFHDLQFKDGSLHQEVMELAEQVRQELIPHSIRPVAHLTDEEAYTVFCIQSPLILGNGERINAEYWLQVHRREVAALLTQESDTAQLSEQESLESTGRYLSYYENDLAVIDWDAALLVDEPRDFDDTLYLIELANFQLAELEAYDRILDEALDRSYRDLRMKSIWRRRDVLSDLREIRIDMARFSDELSNISKFFGDWHLARIYQNVSARFHLADWHRTIDEKLKTLDNLYQLIHHDQNNQWMLILEATIVLLFIIDLIVLFMGLAGK